MRRLLAALVAVLALSGCTTGGEPDEPEIASPFASCDGLTGGGLTSGGLTSGGLTAGGPAGSAPVAAALPDLSLPCFTGGTQVRLRDLRGPAVINIWASWCGPCREELPVIQGLADRAGGRFTVIGVDSGDRRAAAADFATARAITFPTLFDAEKRFADELGAMALPATVFINADGEKHVHREAMDVDDVIELMRKHTGVTVTR